MFKDIIENFRALDMKFKVAIPLAILVGTLIRISNLFDLGFRFDTIETQYTWAKNAFEMGIPDFWKSYKGFFDYWPGSLYILTFIYWISSFLGGDESAFVLTLKLFNWFWEIVFLFFVVYLSQKYGKWKVSQSLVFGAIIYLLPSLWFVGGVWGQFDSFIVVMCLFVILLLYKEHSLVKISYLNNKTLAGGVWGVVLWIKLQAILLVPVLFLYFISKKSLTDIRSFLSGFVLANLLVLIVPLYTNINRLAEVAVIPFTRGDEVSVGASTFWVFAGLGNKRGYDVISTVLPLSIGRIGFLIYALLMLFAVFCILKVKLKELSVLKNYLSIKFSLKTFVTIMALNTGAYFLFMTKMHSRYLHFGVLFMLCSLALFKFESIIKYIWVVVIGIQFSYFLNQLSIYSHFYDSPVWIDKLSNLSRFDMIWVSALLNFVFFTGFYFWCVKFCENTEIKND